METISVGVRDFALPCPRTGSIETSSQSGFGPLPVQGVETHNYFLNKRKKQIPGYEIETKLSRCFEEGGYEIKISGRVDGFYKPSNDLGDLPIIEEIKSDFDISKLESTLAHNPDHPYCLQLLTYGYFYKLETGKDTQLQLILVSSKDNQSKTIKVEFDPDKFQGWFDKRLTEVVQEYEKWQAKRSAARLKAETIKFPYKALRVGQDQLMETAENTVENGHQALIQAPTGLGKTMGVLYPALKSTLKAGNQIVYVTAKNSQHEAVVEATKEINESSKINDLKVLVLTAKSKVCLKEEVYCNSDYCEYAKDYYTKLHRNKVKEEVACSEIMSKDEFVRAGEKYKVCPFELSLDSIENADIVVGDYNYVFSPRNIMGRFASRFQTKEKVKPTLLIDEAHNLPDRAKSYYSSSLSEENLLDLKARVIKQLPNNAIQGQALIEELLWLMRSYTNEGRYSIKATQFNPGKFEVMNNKINDFVRSYLSSALVLQEKDPLLELNSVISDFSDCLNHAGVGFAHIVKTDKGGLLKVVCLDASKKLSDTYSKVKSTVAFSATLKPFDYFAQLLGMDEEKNLIQSELDSPFPSENRKLMIIPQLSTKYRDRPRNYPKIRESIKRITALKKGNYVVFFPSYKFMEDVLAEAKLSHASIISQKRSMTREQIRSYLDKLKDDSQSTVLFAVQGGVFSEGIDYRGKMLIGAIIVGPALPRFDIEAELLQKYYDQKNGCGYKYTYVYPAMTKVIQSAGRVIRSEKDLGLLILLGRRFITDEYKEVMPEYWTKPEGEGLVSSSIESDIERFWRSHQSVPKPQLTSWAEKIKSMGS